MELRYSPIEYIHETKLNMRHDRRPPDVSDILPTVRAKGILQPLFVRPYAGAGEEAVEIVAGRRRYWCGRPLLTSTAVLRGNPVLYGVQKSQKSF